MPLRKAKRTTGEESVRRALRPLGPEYDCRPSLHPCLRCVCASVATSRARRTFLQTPQLSLAHAAPDSIRLVNSISTIKHSCEAIGRCMPSSRRCTPKPRPTASSPRSSACVRGGLLNQRRGMDNLLPVTEFPTTPPNESLLRCCTAFPSWLPPGRACARTTTR
jgi:hypothetical protein